MITPWSQGAINVAEHDNSLDVPSNGTCTWLRKIMFFRASLIPYPFHPVSLVRSSSLRFSSGGTRSVLHSDSYQNLHCVVSGRKEFVLIEPKYTETIGPELQEIGYYPIDVDR